MLVRFEKLVKQDSTTGLTLVLCNIVLKNITRNPLQSVFYIYIYIYLSQFYNYSWNAYGKRCIYIEKIRLKEISSHFKLQKVCVSKQD